MSAADRARGVVADWTLLLVGGLPDRIARERFDEIVSDLWEQQHDEEARGRRSLWIAASLLLRAARGVPADLSWRWAEGHRAAPGVVPIPAARKERMMSRKKHPNPAAKPWVHLTDTKKPFDQTNGVVDFDVEDAHDASNPTRDLIEKGAASNIINVGLGGF